MYFPSHYDKMTKEPLKGSNSYFWLMILMDSHHFGGKSGVYDWWELTVCLFTPGEPENREDRVRGTKMIPQWPLFPS